MARTKENIIARKRTRTKYGVSITEAGIKRRTANDYYTGEPITFDSELECRFYTEVVLKGLKDGTILKYKLQQKYNLQPSFKYMDSVTIRSIDYISDFDLWLADGRFIVLDTKGRATADAKIKKKLLHFKYPDLLFYWVSYTKETGWVTYEYLQKHRREKKKAKKVS